MAVWELVNPSDQFTLDADGFEVAALACLLLGSGAYGLKAIPEDKGRDFPVLLFGDEAVLNQVWQEKFGHLFRESREHVSNEALVACLESLVIGDRVLYQETLALLSEERRPAFDE